LNSFNLLFISNTLCMSFSFLYSNNFLSELFSLPTYNDLHDFFNLCHFGKHQNICNFEFLQIKISIILKNSEFKFQFIDKKTNRLFHRLFRVGNKRKANNLSKNHIQHISNSVITNNFFQNIVGVERKCFKNPKINSYINNNIYMKNDMITKNGNYNCMGGINLLRKINTTIEYPIELNMVVNNNINKPRINDKYYYYNNRNDKIEKRKKKRAQLIERINSSIGVSTFNKILNNLKKCDKITTTKFSHIAMNSGVYTTISQIIDNTLKELNLIYRTNLNKKIIKTLIMEYLKYPIL